MSFRDVAGVLSDGVTMTAITRWLPCQTYLEKVAIITFCALCLLVIDNHRFVEPVIFQNRPRAALVVITLLETFGPDILEPKTSHLFNFEIFYV